MHQALNIIELACWHTDMRIESHIAANPAPPHRQPGYTVPAYLKLVNTLVRYVWYLTMRTINFIYVSHCSWCNQSRHQLPNDVACLVNYFLDHPTGPCADYNLNWHTKMHLFDAAKSSFLGPLPFPSFPFWDPYLPLAFLFWDPYLSYLFHCSCRSIVQSWLLAFWNPHLFWKYVKELGSCGLVESTSVLNIWKGAWLLAIWNPYLF